MVCTAPAPTHDKSQLRARALRCQAQRSAASQHRRVRPKRAVHDAGRPHVRPGQRAQRGQRARERGRRRVARRVQPLRGVGRLRGAPAVAPRRRAARSSWPPAPPSTGPQARASTCTVQGTPRAVVTCSSLLGCQRMPQAGGLDMQAPYGHARAGNRMGRGGARGCQATPGLCVLACLTPCLM